MREDNRNGAAAIIVFPLLYGTIGFVSMSSLPWLYVVLAGLIGGVHIEVKWPAREQSGS